MAFLFGVLLGNGNLHIFKVFNKSPVKKIIDMLVAVKKLPWCYSNERSVF